MTDQASVGALIREWRQARGMTQREVAERTGVHHTYLSKVEAGEQRPGYDLTQRLALLLCAGDPLAPIALHVAAGQLPAGFEERMRIDPEFAKSVWTLWLTRPLLDPPWPDPLPTIESERSTPPPDPLL